MLIDTTDCIITQTLALIDQMYCHLKISENGSRNSSSNSIYQPISYDEYLLIKNVLLLDLMELNHDEDIENEPIPSIIETRLFSNYPNPFNPTTTISFDISTESIVKIDVYNIRGQRVKSLVDEYYQVGRYTIDWNGTDDNGKNVSSGLYFYQMRVGDFIQTRKMIMMK